MYFAQRKNSVQVSSESMNLSFNFHLLTSESDNLMYLSHLYLLKVVHTFERKVYLYYTIGRSRVLVLSFSGVESCESHSWL